jgi:NAD(P)-dependent dehydrogenase (short-subunit alcohol dehydrogenase family)
MTKTMTQQAPLHSGFGESTTAQEAIAGRDLRDRIAIVTGGHAGIGLETTRALAGAGATVVIGARNVDAARAAVAGIPRVEVSQLDLIDPASVDAFAARFAASGRPLHLLVNNAGIMATPLVRDARGFESQLATNHVGHFQLAVRLLPALRAANGARVVALSSRGHARGGVDFEDPHFERRAYEKWQAYGQSKSANVLFAVALDARGRADQIRAFAVHPGAVMTDLVRFVPVEELAALRARLAGTKYKNPAEGAATSIWCATSPQLADLGGVYCEDCDIARPIADPSDTTTLWGVRPWATDPALADRLWTLSEGWLPRG